MISVVMPYYNESACIGPVLRRTRDTLLRSGIGEFEILVIDNGSTDSERDHLLSTRDCPELRVVSLSRNFGYQGALWAGLDCAKGDPVILMDADGEDPPEVIEQFIEKWRQGYDVAFGVRTGRKRSLIFRFFYSAFYRIIARTSNFTIPQNAGEFSLISGRALEALRSFNDRTRMLRLLRAWIGFRQAAVPYQREKRIGGEPKFTFFSAARFAWDGFVATTDIPVRMAVYCAIFCATLASAGIIYYLAWYFLGDEKIPGFASLNITVLFLFSMLFTCIAVLSRYVITLLEETRKRPPYLVAGETPERAPDSRHEREFRKAS